ncbi:unnamed protein product [Peronospora belbahrii]|uniref:WW domain-containing protein n=1 Tax=Peronospora belbahrii TaxID=622444 RepID=A0AAU9KUH1_9STRA|nr:unnamed protein product [Peronospora belbahrii]
MRTPHVDAKQHLDGFACAPGLIQLSSAAAEASAEADNISSSSSNNNAAYYNDSNNNDNRNTVFATADASLPSGWQRIIHGSGLPCYVHSVLGVVCWTRPYLLCAETCDTLSQPEFHRLVKQHVPPLSIFTPPENVATKKKKVVTSKTALSSMTAPQEMSSAQLKKRKLDGVAKEQKSTDQQQLMTLEEFKMLSISDPRILQACMELSIKTPAQVLQEYQNRNRGVSINYNTVQVEGGGVKLFKTIVTAGSTVAEGVASTKKIAKQLGAQQVLAVLHEHTARTYYEVAEMYNNSLKGQPATAESSTYGPTVPLRNDVKGKHSTGDLRHQRGGSASNHMRTRRSPPNQEYDGSSGYRDYGVDRRGNAPPQWSTYNQQPMQLSQQQVGLWDCGGQQKDAGMDNARSERVVVYSTTPAGSAGDYSSGQYYNNAYMGGNAWGHYPNANHPSEPHAPQVYSQQYIGSYEGGQPPAENRPYGNYHSSDETTRVTANLRNQMLNQ